MSASGRWVGAFARVPTISLEYAGQWYLLCTNCGSEETFDSERAMERARGEWGLRHLCLGDAPGAVASP